MRRSREPGAAPCSAARKRPPPMKARLERALWSAVDAIEAAGLRHAVVGGVAFGAWARPRATRDKELDASIGGNDVSGRLARATTEAARKRR